MIGARHVEYAQSKWTLLRLTSLTGEHIKDFERSSRTQKRYIYSTSVTGGTHEGF